MKKNYLLFFALCIFSEAMSQKVITLYTGEIPFSKPCKKKESQFIDTSWNKEGILIVRNITNPTITVYEPEKNTTGASVLICPGGGYWIVAAGHEGEDVAKEFNKAGVTAFVLRYRLPDSSCMTNKLLVPLCDAQEAIHFIRSHATEYGIDKNQIGIMGFSAGGRLAASAGTHFNDPVNKSYQPADVRPDFMMLIYPVISFKDSIGHMGSREALMGKKPKADDIKYFSNEEQVTSKTPSAFLVHASDDGGVKDLNRSSFL